MDHDALLNTRTKIQFIREIADKFDFIKIKNIFCAKENFKKLRRQTDWKEVSEKTHLVKGSYTKYTKNFYNSIVGKQITRLKK